MASPSVYSQMQLPPEKERVHFIPIKTGGEHSDSHRTSASYAANGHGPAGHFQSGPEPSPRSRQESSREGRVPRSSTSSSSMQEENPEQQWARYGSAILGINPNLRGSGQKKKMPAFMQRMQRGGFIQGFGAVVVVRPGSEGSLHAVAFSENVREVLGLAQMSAWNPKKMALKSSSAARDDIVVPGKVEKKIKDLRMSKTLMSQLKSALTSAGGAKRRGQVEHAETPPLHSTESSPPVSSSGIPLTGNASSLQNRRRSFAGVEERAKALAADSQKWGEGEVRRNSFAAGEEERRRSGMGAGNSGRGGAGSGSRSRGNMMHGGDELQPSCVGGITPGQWLKLQSKNGTSSKTKHAELEFGTDIRTLFTEPSNELLEAATAAITERHLAEMNPFFLQCRDTLRPIYAIAHRTDQDLLVFDLEPVGQSGILHKNGSYVAQRLALPAVARIQKVPPGAIESLCQVAVEEIRTMTGFDRVMAYKFHEDLHGEVIAEDVREDLEPFLGLHYPASDIPEASRILFLQNKVRLIHDCCSPPVKMLQDTLCLSENISLSKSTLRGVHGCHLLYMQNMGSMASLTLAIILEADDSCQLADLQPISPSSTSHETGKGGNGQDVGSVTSAAKGQKKGQYLWGLVVCHHTSARFVPYPLRTACCLVMESFQSQLKIEVSISEQSNERQTFRVQSLLCRTALQSDPIRALFASSSDMPNIMDLVPCDGAAIFFRGKVMALGLAPSDQFVHELVDWVQEFHGSSAGMSTDSLIQAGFPGGEQLSPNCCGMAVVRFTETDYMFWFRSHVASTIRWAGAKSNGEEEEGEEDDDRERNPRGSFKEFLEVVKGRSKPWRDAELAAVQSMQQLLRKLVMGMGRRERRVLSREEIKELSSTTQRLKHLIEKAPVPILALNSAGTVTAWNGKMVDTTGLPSEMAMGSQMEELVEEGLEDLRGAVSLAFAGKEVQNVQMKMHKWSRENGFYGSLTFVVRVFPRHGVSGRVIGACVVGEDVTEEKAVEEKFVKVQGDLTTIINGHDSLMPPIFGTDELGACIEWNKAMEETTGVARRQVMGEMIVGAVFGKICRLANHSQMTQLMVMINRAICGEETEKAPLSFLNAESETVSVLLSLIPRRDSNGTLLGIFGFIHRPSPEMMQAMVVQRAAEKLLESQETLSVYAKRELSKASLGLRYVHTAIGKLARPGEEEHAAQTIKMCERQLRRTLADLNMEKLDAREFKLERVPFKMELVTLAVLHQSTPTSRASEVKLTCAAPPEMRHLLLLGDATRLQQVLGGLIICAVENTIAGGIVNLRLDMTPEVPSSKDISAKFRFRISSSNQLSREPVQHLSFQTTPRRKTPQGMALCVYRDVLQLMGGSLVYRVEGGSGAFIITLDMGLERKRTRRKDTKSDH